MEMIQTPQSMEDELRPCRNSMIRLEYRTSTVRKHGRIGIADPIRPLDNRFWFVRYAFRKPPLLPFRRRQHQRPEQPFRQHGRQSELPPDLIAHYPNLPCYAFIRGSENVFHRPQQSGIAPLQCPRLVAKPPANPQIRMVLVAHPALQRRPANPKQAWPVALEVASERPIQKLLRLVPRDRR